MGQRMAQLASQRQGDAGGAVAPVLAVRTAGTHDSTDAAVAGAYENIPTWVLESVQVTPSVVKRFASTLVQRTHQMHESLWNTPLVWLEALTLPTAPLPWHA